MRFLFYIPDTTSARGGISVTFDMIDILNAQGIEAVALYDRPDFEYDRHWIRAPRLWSPQVRPPRDWKSLGSVLRSLRNQVTGRNRRPPANAQRCPQWTYQPEDVVIVPEFVSDWLPRGLPAPAPLVILNQNPFSFFNASIRPGFDRRRFAESISISEVCSKSDDIVLGRRGKSLSLYISDKVYAFQQDKKFQIAYMPRKRGEETRLLIAALKQSGLPPEAVFLPIDGVSSTEAARMIRASLFFLSFSQREGFGLPAAEAMATGALVIGYKGVGGDEFFNDDTGFPVPEDDLIAFHEKAVSVICDYHRNPAQYDEKRREASRRILRDYSHDTFRREVIRVFREIERDLTSPPV